MLLQYETEAEAERRGEADRVDHLGAAGSSVMTPAYPLPDLDVWNGHVQVAISLARVDQGWMKVGGVDARACDYGDC